MHKLERSTTNPPACLSAYDWNSQSWDEVKSADKKVIRANLKLMQESRCAYCEGSIHDGGHIEHFQRKNSSHFPQLTFDWSNLFLSCDALDHCGHYKDRPGATPYHPQKLIKPDVDDPDQYLYFHSSGEVRPRSGCGTRDVERASETIQVFNLDHGGLRAARRRVLKIYLAREPGILEALIGFKEQDRRAFIADEVKATCLQPHATVIRHFFEKAH